MWIFWIVGAVAAAVAGAAKGRSAVAWFFYGLLIWPVAIVHALCLSRKAPDAVAVATRIPCPTCREPIFPDALICLHCRTPHADGERFREALVQEQAAQRARAVEDAIAWKRTAKRGWILLVFVLACGAATVYYATKG